MKRFAAIFVVLLAGCSKRAPETQFHHDYAVVYPLAVKCEDLFYNGLVRNAEDCVLSIEPALNHVVREANTGDDAEGSQNIKANLLSARINILESEILLWHISNHQ